MFIDASALCAIFANEPDAAELLARIEAHSLRLSSPLAVWETVRAMTRLRCIEPTEALRAVQHDLGLLNVQLVAIPPEAAALAIDAFERFGKGRHPAALNFGDCFAYACARHFALPLLYKGEDFARTDVAAA